MNSVSTRPALDSLVSPVADHLRTGELPIGGSIVHERSGGRGPLLRMPYGDASTVIVKVWLQRRLRDRLKRFLGISNAQREWHTHCHLHAAGARLPEPFGYCASTAGKVGFEMVVVEDLGALINGLIYLKQCLRDGDEVAASQFERDVIDTTASLVRNGVLDIDNKLNNFGVTSDGRVFRLDIECARRWRRSSLPHDLYGAMIGRLVSSHAFACQPSLGRTELFALALRKRLDPPARVLTRARGEIEDVLQRQKDASGIDSQLSLPW
ncbi:hypothetical protein [Thioalkalivibrio sp. XN8]|uniref:hypothetical protein n=1 Tax=Thioalkalivibrio sp. XN8 TaxID=2712863 RepID=UPI0013EB6240|nr:hypothetical protein [Thioalkalivibrio sp. XN8]NGP53712.1 hypothetical protein [Thioalkalivibrio sp. XN8]